MIKPTIGRVVWYHPPSIEPVSQPEAALICWVWSDTRVNLAVFDANGVASNRTDVYLHQPDSEVEPPVSGYCEWMPYQQGQAAKAEALEKELATKAA